MRSFEAHSGKERASLEEHWIADRRRPFGPDGRAVLRGPSRRPAEEERKGEALVFWDAGTGRAEVAFDDGTLLWDEALSPEGGKLGIAGGGRLRLIDIRTGRESASVADDASRCVFSPDAKYLMSANSPAPPSSADFDPPEPDSKERRQVLRLRDGQTLALRRTISFRISEDGTGGCGFSPDGRLVYWASDERVVIFDLVHPRRFFFRDKAGGLTGVSFSRDSAQFAVGNGRGEVILFRLESGDPGAPAATAIAADDGLFDRCAWCAERSKT
jgi:WD40 repeat protein